MKLSLFVVLLSVSAMASGKPHLRESNPRGVQRSERLLGKKGKSGKKQLKALEIEGDMALSSEFIAGQSAEASSTLVGGQFAEASPTLSPSASPGPSLQPSAAPSDNGSTRRKLQKAARPIEGGLTFPPPNEIVVGGLESAPTLAPSASPGPSNLPSLSPTDEAPKEVGGLMVNELKPWKDAVVGGLESPPTLAPSGSPGPSDLPSLSPTDNVVRERNLQQYIAVPFEGIDLPDGYEAVPVGSQTDSAPTLAPSASPGPSDLPSLSPTDDADRAVGGLEVSLPEMVVGGSESAPTLAPSSSPGPSDLPSLSPTDNVVRERNLQQYIAVPFEGIDLPDGYEAVPVGSPTDSVPTLAPSASPGPSDLPSLSPTDDADRAVGGLEVQEPIVIAVDGGVLPDGFGAVPAGSATDSAPTLAPSSSPGPSDLPSLSPTGDVARERNLDEYVVTPDGGGEPIIITTTLIPDGNAAPTLAPSASPGPSDLPSLAPTDDVARERNLDEYVVTPVDGGEPIIITTTLIPDGNAAPTLAPSASPGPSDLPSLAPTDDVARERNLREGYVLTPIDGTKVYEGEPITISTTLVSEGEAIVVGGSESTPTLAPSASPGPSILPSLAPTDDVAREVGGLEVNPGEGGYILTPPADGTISYEGAPIIITASAQDEVVQGESASVPTLSPSASPGPSNLPSLVPSTV